MKNKIEVICRECGSKEDYDIQLLWDNKGATIRCHVCAEPYTVVEILEIEKHGISDFRGKNG